MISTHLYTKQNVANVHVNTCYVSSRQCHVTLIQYHVTLRQCHLTLRQCHVTLRQCHVTLFYVSSRQCHVTLRQCHLTPRQCHLTPRQSAWFWGCMSLLSNNLHATKDKACTLISVPATNVEDILLFGAAKSALCRSVYLLHEKRSNLIRWRHGDNY